MAALAEADRRQLAELEAARSRRLAAAPGAGEAAAAAASEDPGWTAGLLMKIVDNIQVGLAALHAPDAGRARHAANFAILVNCRHAVAHSLLLLFMPQPPAAMRRCHRPLLLSPSLLFPRAR